MKRILVSIVALVFLCSAAFAAKTAVPKSSTKINPKDGAEMMWVPAGEFLMGSTDEEIAALVKANPKLNANAFDTEKPQRKVYLDGYWIYKCEVTVAQYRKFCKETNREMPKAPTWGWKDDHPVVNINWQDAADYAKWAGASLPTEAQWEKAARGTDGRAYPWGSKWPPPAGSGNFADESFTKKYPKRAASLTKIGLPLKGYDDGYAEAAPVGKFPAGASPNGCMDMAGNVWEWCADWYGEDYYKTSPSRNPKGPATGGYRVLRGGSWYGGLDSGYGYYSCACRYGYDPSNYYYNVGFRLVR